MRRKETLRISDEYGTLSDLKRAIKKVDSTLFPKLHKRISVCIYAFETEDVVWKLCKDIFNTQENMARQWVRWWNNGGLIELCRKEEEGLLLGFDVTFYKTSDRDGEARSFWYAGYGSYKGYSVYLKRNGYMKTLRKSLEVYCARYSIFDIDIDRAVKHAMIHQASLSRQLGEPLRPADVRAIYQASGLTCVELSKKYGCSTQVVSMIRTGKTWRKTTHGLKKGYNASR